MRKISFIILSVLALTSCEKPIGPETAKAFVGEYWMKTTTVGVAEDHEYPMSEKSVWTPVSIYEKNGKLYVQTEMLGALDFGNKNPEEIEGTKERPDFIAARRVISYYEEQNDSSGIETIVVPFDIERIVVVNGNILLLSGNVRGVKTLPIKVKSGSETILHLEEYKPVEVEFTNAAGDSIGKAKAWYEYGPMVKNGETITWDVEYKDEYTSLNGQEKEYDRIIHKNTLYKLK